MRAVAKLLILVIIVALMKFAMGFSLLLLGSLLLTAVLCLIATADHSAKRDQA